MRVFAFYIFAACILTLSGCDSSTPAPPTAGPVPGAQNAAPKPTDAQALFDRWKMVVTDPQINAQGSEHLAITSQLVNTAPEMLDKMIDLLVDPATQPVSQYMIVDCLGFAQNAKLHPRLLTLTEPGTDPIIRTHVTTILARSIDPHIVDRVRLLANDPERRVKLAALSGLTEAGDSASRELLREYYFTEGLPPEHRARLVEALSAAPHASCLDVFTHAAQDATLPENFRIAAVRSLGRLADPAALPALEIVANDANAPATLKQIAGSAVEVIKTSPATSETPTSPVGPAPSPSAPTPP